MQHNNYKGNTHAMIVSSSELPVFSTIHDIIAGRRFLCYGPYLVEICPSNVGLSIFSSLLVWTSCRTISRITDAARRHVLSLIYLSNSLFIICGILNNQCRLIACIMTRIKGMQGLSGHDHIISTDIIATSKFRVPIQHLTHCGLVTSYGDINLGQHWLR